MCNCIIIGSFSDGISIVYQVHYIGWSNYIQEVKMEDLKPFIPFNWKAYNYQMTGKRTISAGYLYRLNCLYTADTLKSIDEKVILFTQQIKKITKNN